MGERRSRSGRSVTRRFEPWQSIIVCALYVLVLALIFLVVRVLGG